jgi:hypothetical protein
MVERSLSMREVGGSMPPFSIIFQIFFVDFYISSQGGTEGELRLPASSALPAADPGLPGKPQTAATMQFNVGKVTLALVAFRASCVIRGLAIVPACFQSESLVLFCDDDSAEMEALAAACALITSH